MNPSREDQEKIPEGKDAATSRAEAFDKWLCWNPGHNAREREIVAHMTPEERRRFQWLSALGGAVLALTMIGAMSTITPVFFERDIGGKALVGCLVVFLPIVGLAIIGVRRSAKKFMRNTAWAREQGWGDDVAK